MKPLLATLTLCLSSCLPFYSADETNWTIGIRGTHQEVIDTIRNFVEPDSESLAK